MSTSSNVAQGQVLKDGQKSLRRFLAALTTVSSLAIPSWSRASVEGKVVALGQFPPRQRQQRQQQPQLRRQEQREAEPQPKQQPKQQPEQQPEQQSEKARTVELGE